MSVAGYIKELLSEDMYDNAFNERIEERVNALNAAQLQGMYAYLQSTAKASKSAMWAGVNAEIISKMEGKMKFMTEQEEKRKAKVQEEKLKAKQKIIIQNEARREKKRVLKMIIDTAQKAAAEEVKEEENKRQADEKVIIMQKTFVAEEKRNKWWKYTAAVYLVFFVIICVVIKYLYVLIGALFFITFVAAYVVYYASKFTIILPEEVPPEIIDARIREKQDVIKKEKISLMVDKELKYQQQVARDKLDKKKRIAEKKAKQALEIKLMEQRRLEQIALAKQALAQQASKSAKMTLDRMQREAAEFNEDVPEDLEDDPERSRMITTHAGKLTRYGTAVNPFDHLEVDDMSGFDENQDDKEDASLGDEGQGVTILGHDRIGFGEGSDEDSNSVESPKKGPLFEVEDEMHGFSTTDGDEENQIVALKLKENQRMEGVSKVGIVDELDQRPDSILSKKKKKPSVSSKVSFKGGFESQTVLLPTVDDKRLSTMV